MKTLILGAALLCSIGVAFAHSSGTGSKQGCHKHSPQDVPHCH
ncbi:hypothetical protein [Acinetobacter sp. TGL-Y2]|nr:hypothetical protein [Acinetobacter sp. TGL-Y2]